MTTRGKAKQHPSLNLMNRLVDFKKETLAFLNGVIPFTNNQGERDIRMIKVKHKISGCFRSPEGAKMFCRMRGYLSTARKQGVSAISALMGAFYGNAFTPDTS